MTEKRLLAALDAAATGDTAAKERLFVLLYDELHALARRELRKCPPITLGPTGLLHETFLNISQREDVSFPDQSRFIVYAARAMRGLLIDYIRRGQAQKRGSEFEITSLPTSSPELATQHNQVEELNAALEWLAATDERLAQCVDLKFFCGFSFVEIADMFGVSERTVQRDWNNARVLLRRFMKGAADTLTSAATCAT